MNYFLALDQGTSSSRSIVFDTAGQVVAMAQAELPQIFPQPGWVEHDPMVIWQTQLDTARQALSQARLKAADIAALGITNQRETTVVWNRLTGQPIHHAIVWQDRRTGPVCADLRQAGKASTVQDKTGLVIDPYFSGTKLQWLLNQVPGARTMAERGELLFGTVDTWLIWQLTGGALTHGRAQARHLTDVSNASRTMLLNIRSNDWDEEMLELLQIPRAVLPRVIPSAADFGQTHPELLGSTIRIGGVAGDQQSALFGQACFEPGMAKNTYGTGCFMLMHTGDVFMRSGNGLLTTSAAQTSREPAFALEGSVFVGGAVVQWLRDGLHAIKSSAEVQALAQSVPDSGGVMLVPAFTGLGAPYWQADARGTITGLSRGSTLAHIARAALDAIAHQSAALLQAMSADALANGASAVSELRVDGGACANDLLMQIQADLLGVPVVRPAVIETTALGAAYLAGLSIGTYASLGDVRDHWKLERVFEPKISRDEAQSRMAQWERAVRQTLAA